MAKVREQDVERGAEGKQRKKQPDEQDCQQIGCHTHLSQTLSFEAKPMMRRDSQP